MKPQIRNCALSFLIILLPLYSMKGQEKKQNYGNIPDELVAFDKYQKAYKYHFLVPIKFYGAGRELKPPTDLKDVRIGFLGPLEGSIISDLGEADAAGLCNGYRGGQQERRLSRNPLQADGA